MPDFTAPVSGANTATIAENSAADTSVFDVTYSEPDSDPVTVSIVSQTPGSNFKLDGSQLQVAESAALDFESGITSYTVRFQ